MIASGDRAAEAGSTAAAASRHSREVRTLAHAWHEFRRKRSPRVIAAAIVLALAVRLLIGDFSWRDGAAAAGMLVVYPFAEWAIHVYLLHLRPLRFGERRIELATARAHRQHHEAPNDLSMVLLGPLEATGLLLLVVPLPPALAALVCAVAGVSVPVAALVTAILTGCVLVGVYEWTHFLIHTAYRPRTRYFHSIRRSHRLHHFKNEHYWHGITSTLGDRALGTFPEQRDVPRSPTARTLDPGSAG